MSQNQQLGTFADFLSVNTSPNTISVSAPLTIANNLTVTGTLTLSGNTVISGANNLVLQSSVLSLHTQANLAPLTSDDGQNIGIAFHYYDDSDRQAFLARVDTTGYLAYYNTSTDVVLGPVSGTDLGTIQAASFVAGNATVYTVTNATTFSGTANNASYLSGNTVSDLHTYSDNKAANAYSNAVTYASLAAANAYSNAIAYAGTAATSNAAQAYSNAVSYTDLAAANAYSNAVSYAANVAANAYSNAVSYAGNAAANAYSNAIAYSGNAALAYANAVTYTNNKAANAYANAIAYSGNAAQAYSNATTYADNKAANAYSNAVTYAGNKADNAYSNAVTYSSLAAANAYSNAISYAALVAANAYSNAISYAGTAATSNAAQAYSNAVTYADNKAANAYSNAVTYAGLAASNAYTNAVSYTDNKAANAYSNAIAYSGNSVQAYTNAISYAANAAANAYSNATSYADLAATNAYSNATSYASLAAANAYSNAIAYSGNAAQAYANAIAYTNTNIVLKTGTIFTGNVIFNANIVANTLVANGSLGTVSQVLTANSTGGLYWASDQFVGNVVANVVTSNTLTSNHVVVNNDISIVNGSYSNTAMYSDRIFIGNGDIQTTVNSTTFWATFSNTSSHDVYISSITSSGGYINSTAIGINLEPLISLGMSWRDENGGGGAPQFFPQGSPYAVSQNVFNVNASFIQLGNSTNYANFTVGNNAPTIQFISPSATGGGITINQSGISTGNSVSGTTANTQGFYINGTEVYARKTGATFTGSTVFTANITVNGAIVAGGNTGQSGQFLTSNGTSNVYWSSNVGVLQTGNLTSDAIYVTVGNLSIGNTVANTDISNNGIFIQNASSYSVTLNLSGLNIGNTTVNSTVNSTTFSGTSLTANNSSYLNGNTALTLINYASNAYANAIAYSGNASQAYSNAIAYAANAAANAYSNAVLVAGNAFSNAIAYAANAAANAYSNAVLVAANAYSNAISYTNTNIALKSGTTFTGSVVINANLTVNNNLTVTGNLILSGSTTFINSTVITTTDKNIILANGAANTFLTSGAGIVAGSYANLVFDDPTTSWQSNVNITPYTNNLSLGATTKLFNLYANQIIANGSMGTVGQVLASNGTSVYWTIDQTAGNVSANIVTSNTLSANHVVVNNDLSVVNGTYSNVSMYSDRLFIGNSTVNATVNSTVFSGTSLTANNSTYLNGNSAANLIGYATNAYSNAIAYSGNAALAYANAISYTNTSIALLTGAAFTGLVTHTANVSVNGAIIAGGNSGSAGQVLTSNGSGNVYWSTVSGGSGSINTAAQYTFSNTITFGNATVNAAISSNSTVTSFSGTANNALNFGGYGLSTFVTNSQLSTTLTNYVNTTANFTYTGTQTFSNLATYNANVTINAAIIAGGNSGQAGQVLTSNGSGNVYWSTVTGGGGGGSVNTSAQYTWTNTQTFTTNVFFSNLSMGATSNSILSLITKGSFSNTWTTNTPTGFALKQGLVAYAPTSGNTGIFLAKPVNTNTSYYSTDGVTWSAGPTIANAAGTTLANANILVYVPNPVLGAATGEPQGKFVLGVGNTTLYYINVTNATTSAINWKTSSAPANVTYMAYGAGRLVALVSNATVSSYTSSVDANTWSPQTSAINGLGKFIAYYPDLYGGRFVAMFGGYRMETSTDGYAIPSVGWDYLSFNATTLSTNGTINATSLNSPISYNPVTGTYLGVSNNYIFSSTDFVNWTVANNGVAQWYSLGSYGGYNLFTANNTGTIYGITNTVNTVTTIYSSPGINATSGPAFISTPYSHTIFDNSTTGNNISTFSYGTTVINPQQRGYMDNIIIGESIPTRGRFNELTAAILTINPASSNTSVGGYTQTTIGDGLTIQGGGSTSLTGIRFGTFYTGVPGGANSNMNGNGFFVGSSTTNAYLYSTGLYFNQNNASGTNGLFNTSQIYINPTAAANSSGTGGFWLNPTSGLYLGNTGSSFGITLSTSAGAYLYLGSTTQSTTGTGGAIANNSTYFFGNNIINAYMTANYASGNLILVMQNTTTNAYLTPNTLFIGNASINTTVNTVGIYLNPTSGANTTGNGGLSLDPINGMFFGNNTINATYNTSTIILNPTASANTTGTGGLYINTIGLFIGNSTVNTIQNTSSLSINPTASANTTGTGGFNATGTGIFLGNNASNVSISTTTISIGAGSANTTGTGGFNATGQTLFFGNSATNVAMNTTSWVMGAPNGGKLTIGTGTANTTGSGALQWDQSGGGPVLWAGNNSGNLYWNGSYNTSEGSSLLVSTAIGTGTGTGKVNTSSFFAGNNSVNAYISVSSLAINPSSSANTTGTGGAYLTGTALTIGNSTSNAVINTTGVYVNGTALINSINTAAQYTWTNTQTFTNTITHTANVIINNTLTVGNSTVNTQTNATHFYTGNSTYYGYGNNITDSIVSPSGNIIISSTYVALSNSTASNTVVVSTSGITFGNSTVNAAITTNSTVTSFSGTANNALNFGGYGLSTFVTNSQLSTTLTNYVNTTANFTYTGTQTFSNTVIHAGILGVNSVIQINGSNGTAGQVLTSNGSGNVYWSNVSGGGSVNTASQYTFTNTITFSNTITIANVSANGTTGTSGQVLTSNGTVAYWALPNVPQSNAISDSFTANGTQTTFTISTAVRNQNNSIVTLDGMVQLPVTHYSISGTTLTMTTAPIANSIVEVRNFDNIYAGGGVSTGKAIAMAIVFGG